MIRQIPRPARPHHRNHLDPLLGRLRFVNVRRRKTLYWAWVDVCTSLVNVCTVGVFPIVVCLLLVDVEVRIVHYTVRGCVAYTITVLSGDGVVL